MASGALRSAPWTAVVRTRSNVDLLVNRVWSQAKIHFSTSYQFSADNPSAKALENMPYPTTPVDRSIFEEESSEYATAMKHSTPLPVRNVVSAAEKLLQLVEAGDFIAAEALRADFVELDIPIPPHHFYEKAAKNALSRNFEGDRLEAFTNWFSLVPDANARRKPRHFRNMRRTIFSASVPQLDIIMRFGLIAASQGHARHITDQVIQEVVRYAEPTVSTQYLEDFENAAMKWKRGSLHRGRHGPRGAHILRDIYKCVIKTHAHAGRLGEALVQLQRARDRKIFIPLSPLLVLMHKLKKAGNYEAIRVHIPSHVQGMLDPAPSSLYDELAQASTLASKLRIWRKYIKPNDSRTGFPPKPLVEFIHTYKQATGRDTALALLRSRAFKSGAQRATDWAMAELLYHRSRNEHRLLLVIYRHYFHLVGVPPHIVNHCIRTWAPRARFARQSWNDQSDEYVVKVRQRWEKKLWPTGYHTALAWEAIVLLSKPETVDVLYRLLLSQAREKLLPHIPPSAVDSQVVADINHIPSLTIDHAHFTPFFFAWTNLNETERISQLMADMVKLGIRPSVKQWTILATYYTGHHDSQIAMNILDDMEAQAQVDDDPDARVPLPTIETYTSMLAGFTKAGRLDEALNIKARMLAKFLIVRRKWPQTDRALRQVALLENEVRTICRFTLILIRYF